MKGAFDMRIFGKRIWKGHSVGQVVRAEHQRQASEARAVIDESLPEMAKAITRIEAANSLPELETALSDLCRAYEPVFAVLVASEEASRAGDLHAMNLAWLKPAIRKAVGLVVASGRSLTPVELVERMGVYKSLDYPEYTSILGERPIPPWAEAATLMRAAKRPAQEV